MRGSIVLTLAAASLLAGAAPAVAADACPNAPFRQGVGVDLPECRAYEQVSPVDKNGVNVLGFNLGSAAESRASYFTLGAFPEADSSTYTVGYASGRTADGWSTRGIDPPIRSARDGGVLTFTATTGVSEDLQSATVVSTRKLTDDAVEGNQNSYLKDLRTGALRLIASLPDGAVSGLFGGSPDARRLAFVSGYPLTTDAPTDRPNLFSWEDGVIRLESRLPDGRLADSATGVVGISADGGRITATMVDGSVNALYQRTGDRTVLISRSHRGTDPQTPVDVASGTQVTRDGGLVTFTTAAATPLTDDSPPGVAGRIYRWSADDGRLVDLLAGVTPTADVSASLLRQSPDGRYVWFTSYRPLAADGQDGQQNVYVLDTATSTLSYAAPFDYSMTWSAGAAAVVFLRDGQAYAYATGTPDAGVYCASCGSAAFPSTGPVRIGAPTSRAVTDDGRVFFDSPDRLVAGDANRLTDAYEFVPGQGLALISSGTSDQPVTFANVGPSGTDAFFVSSDRLVGQDTDALADLYDARVGGGLAAQQAPPAVAPCSGDGCREGAASAPPRPAPGAPAAATPGQPTFSLRTPSAAVRRRAVRTGRLAVRVRVSAAGKVALRARARVGARTRTVATGRRTAARSGTVTVPLRLSAQVRKRLRRGRSVRLTLTASYSRSTASKSVRLTLKRPSTRKKGGSR